MKRDLKKLILQNNHPNSCLVRENFNFQSDDDVGKQICNYLQTQTYITGSTARTTAFCGLGQPEKREDRAQCWDRLWRLLIEHRHTRKGRRRGWGWWRCTKRDFSNFSVWLDTNYKKHVNLPAIQCFLLRDCAWNLSLASGDLRPNKSFGLVSGELLTMQWFSSTVVGTKIQGHSWIIFHHMHEEAKKVICKERERGNADKQRKTEAEFGVGSASRTEK